MDIHSVIESFAEAWVAANTQTPVTAETIGPFQAIVDGIKKKVTALKIEKDNALDKIETAENQLRDASLRVEKATEEIMSLEKKLKQLESELAKAQQEFESTTTTKFDEKEKSLTSSQSLTNLLSSLCARNCKSDDTMTEDTRKKFDQWYFQQVFSHYRQVAELAYQAQQNIRGIPISNGLSTPRGNDSQDAQQQQQQQHHLSIDIIESLAKAAAVAAVSSGHHMNDESVTTSETSHRFHSSQHVIPNQLVHNTQSVQNKSPSQQAHQPQQHQSSNTSAHYVRTRIRTSFDPELELPRLHKWFAENQHPSRAQIHHYVSELNSLESRRGRKPLDSNNVVYWFKNARAAHKRQELKIVNGNTSITSGNTNPWTENSNSPSSYQSQPMQEVSKDDEDESSQVESDDRIETSDENDDQEDNSSVHTLDLSMTPAKRQRIFHSLEQNSSDHMDDMIKYNVSDSQRIRRSRTFIDPMTEVPRLEQWFTVNTHPTHSQIVRFTEELNGLQYRQKFPKLEPKNIQFWFKNRRAKYKRLSIPQNHIENDNNNNSNCQVNTHGPSITQVKISD